MILMFVQITDEIQLCKIEREFSFDSFVQVKIRRSSIVATGLIFNVLELIYIEKI